MVTAVQGTSETTFSLGERRPIRVISYMLFTFYSLA